MQASSFIRDFRQRKKEIYLMKEKNIKIKRMIEFIVFLLISCILFEKVTWILRSNGEEAKEDICGFKNQGNVDVVLYGGSNLLRFYQPLEAWNQKGYTSYNYATSSAKADLLKAYIEDSRVSNEAVLYVCDIRSYPMITETIDDASLRNWSDSLPVFSRARWNGISSFLFSRDLRETDVPSFYLDIIKYHTNTNALKSEDQWRYWNLNGIYNVDKGFDANDGHVPFERPNVIETIGELTSQQANALDELLNYCDDNNLQILFICCPYAITEEDWLTINAVGKRITERGYDFVNFNHYYDEIGLDFETDFGDINHVNFLGAEKYTQYLMNYISSHYELPDHRNDEQYARWNSDYESFTIFQNEWRSDTIITVEDHLNAKQIGETLPNVDEFTEWFSWIKNGNYNVIITINDMPDGLSAKNPLNRLFEKYGIDMSMEHYIGIWRGNEALLTSPGDTKIETAIGKDGGRGLDQCIISLEDRQLLIEDTNYYKAESPMQVLVYDRNYKRVIDNVSIKISSDDSVILKRQ